MREDYTHILIIRDCSGSMERIATDMDGGLKKFIARQADVPGKVTLSLYDFSSQGWWSKAEKRDAPSVRRVYNMTNLDDVVIENMIADGGTPLNDAQGIAISQVGRELAVMSECDRPSKVLVAIISDGEENTSQEYSRSQIRQMVKKQEDEFNWQFTFLGANQDVYAESASFGIKGQSALNFAANKRGVGNAFESLTSGSLRARAMNQEQYCSAVQDGTFYTDEEQQQGDADVKGSDSNDLQGSAS